jgi:uncharacterized membrane protein
MVLIALLLLLIGMIMNIQILLGPLRKRLTPAEIMRTPPYLISVGFVVAGFLLLWLAGR